MQYSSELATTRISIIVFSIIVTRANFYRAMRYVSMSLEHNYSDLILSQQLLPAIRQVSGEFIFLRNIVPTYGACMQIF